MELIVTANEIIEEYQEQGFSLTLRQLYYQFVSRDIIANTQRSYKNLGSLINDARLCGLIDWESIEDRTRNLQSNSHWESAAEIIQSCEQCFAFDKWGDQEYRPEVWIEKDALTGIIQGICESLDVPYFACRGYNSQSEQWRAGQRFADAIYKGQIPLILHLGDHDPSGIDMTRDNQDRITMFAEEDVEVRRLALNYNQVEEYNPPPNPAKLTDSRADGYICKYGKSSWELDALEPKVIVALIKSEILSVRDDEIWNKSIEEENAVKQKFSKFRKQLIMDGD